MLLSHKSGISWPLYGTHSSGTVRDFHPIPFLIFGENRYACKSMYIFLITQYSPENYSYLLLNNLLKYFICSCIICLFYKKNPYLAKEIILTDKKEAVMRKFFTLLALLISLLFLKPKYKQESMNTQ